MERGTEESVGKLLRKMGLDNSMNIPLANEENLKLIRLVSPPKPSL